jgi:hypothetical protein
VIERKDGDARTARQPVPEGAIPDLPWARELLTAIEGRIADGKQYLGGLVPAVQAEIAVVAAESDADATSAGEQSDPLFRLRIRRWAMAADDLTDLVCVRDPRSRVLAFDFDVAELMSVRNAGDLAVPPTPRRSYIVAFGRSGRLDGERRDPLVVDGSTARILELSDGTRTAAAILGELNREGFPFRDGDGLKWIEYLFAHGLISLMNGRPASILDRFPAGADARTDSVSGRGPAARESRADDPVSERAERGTPAI